jgi:hypothetical protein
MKTENILDKMQATKMHSSEWFTLAFEGVDTPEFMKKAAERICHAYSSHLRGTADPGYIANVINTEYKHSQGIYTYDELQLHNAKNQKAPAVLTKVIIPLYALRSEGKKAEGELFWFNYYCCNLLRIGDALNLWNVDENNKPTNPSMFWLGE